MARGRPGGGGAACRGAPAGVCWRSSERVRTQVDRCLESVSGVGPVSTVAAGLGPPVSTRRPPPPLAQHRPLPGRRGRGQPADRPSPAAVSYAWKRSLRRRRRARGRVLGLGSGSGPGAGAGAGRGSHGRRSMFWEGCSAQGNVSSFGCVFDTIRSQAHDRKGNAHARSRIRPSTHRQSNAKSNTPTARPLFSIPASTPPGTETTSRACHRRP